MPAENGRGLHEQGSFTPSWRDSRGENNREAPPGRPADAAGLEAIGEDLQRQYAKLANRGQSATDAVAKDSYLRAAEALSGEIEKYLRMRA